MNTSVNSAGLSRTNYGNSFNSANRRTLGAGNQLAFGLNATVNPTAVEPIISEVHQKIFEQLGGGGLKAVGRAFRLMDTDGNARLNAEELRVGFAECGVELTTSEVRRLFTAADRNGDGSVDLKEFLRFVRGPLPRGRVKVVDDAWRQVDPSGKGVALIADVVAKHYANLHPSVAKGEHTAEEVRAAFEASFVGYMGNPNGTVTRDEFLEYYTGISDGIANHDYFDLIVRNVWRLDQPNNFNKTDADHHQYTVSQFQSSAYRGCTGAFPAPDQPDVVSDKREPRFASMISNNLVPYPIHKLGACPANTASGVYLGASAKGHKINTKDVAEKLANVTLDFEKSATGKVPSMVTSRGFIDNTTSTGTMHGEFSDAVMDTFHSGKAKERAAEAERRALQTTPFTSADPNAWSRSSDAYADYRKVDRSQFTATNAVPKLAHGEGNRSRTQAALEAGNSVDVKALRAQRDGESTSNLPRGYMAPSGAMLTTMKDHFAGYDPTLAEASNDRWASVPLQHKHQVATEAEREAYAAQQARFSSRHEGDFNTEKADKHSPVFDQAEISHTFDVKGAFCIRNGVRCLSDKVHKPRDVQNSVAFTRGTIVPGQFTSMATKPLHTPE